LEIRPKGAPGKGEALERLIGRFLEGRKEGICVHLGDDRTDEDAFQVLQKLKGNALGLKVGEGPTHAHYRLEGLGEVHRFLSLFLGTHKD
jgi:trehalose 6-phosphate phosphatase